MSLGLGWESSPVALFCKDCLLHVLMPLKGDLETSRETSVVFIGLKWVWKEKSLLNLGISSKNTHILLLKSVLSLKLLHELQIKTSPWGRK